MKTEAASSQDFVIETVSGRAVPLRGDDIDTDRIIPARYLRCVTFEGLEKHIFEDDRLQKGGSHPFDDPRFRGAGILVVNRNFGCGSSREHAPQALQRWGIRGIVGESFAEIFFGNCVSLGIPCFTLPAAQVAEIQSRAEGEPRLEVQLDLRSRSIAAGLPGAAVTTYAGLVSDGACERFLGGTWDAAGLLLQKPEEVRAVAEGLPYVSGWV